MINNKLYPWQINDFNNILKLMPKLPNALLLLGSIGIGIDVLAKYFISFLLCNAKNSSDLCNCSCDSCKLLSGGLHPDLFYLTPDITDTKTKSITIKNVRDAVDFISLTPHLSAYKIVFIENMSLLTQSSANALLKILEDSSKYVIFIFISNNLGEILPTIASRCYKYKAMIPSYDEAINYLNDSSIENTKFWLTYYQNSPLFQVELTTEQLNLLINTLVKPSVDNIFNATEVFNGKVISFEFILTFLYKWVHDLVILSLGGNLYYFSDYKNSITPLIPKVKVDKLFYLYDRINFLFNWTNHPLNYQIQIENLLLHYQQIFK